MYNKNVETGKLVATDISIFGQDKTTKIAFLLENELQRAVSVLFSFVQQI